MTQLEKIIRAVHDGQSREFIENSVLAYAKQEYKDICQSCRGKGYSTNYHGIEGAEDLDYVGFKTDLTVHLEYCFCARGKQLREMITAKQKESSLLLLRQIFTNVKRKKVIAITRDSVLQMLRGYWKLIYNEKA